MDRSGGVEVSTIIQGWHFLPADKILPNGDGRKVRVGVKMECRPKGEPIKLCLVGMHGCKRIIDALNYAPGPVISWCEFGGEIEEGGDKFCSRWRKVLWMADISTLLH